MVYIQSATAEIRRKKKKERKIEDTTGQKYNGQPYSIGQPKLSHNGLVTIKSWQSMHIDQTYFLDISNNAEYK